MCTLNIGLMKCGRVEWQEAEETRKDFNIVLTRQDKIRTKLHWSYTSGQCVNSERFLRVHLSHQMCNQFTLHHEFRIDTVRTKFEQKTDSILYGCASYEQNTKILRQSTWKHRVLHGTIRQRVRNIKTRCIGSTYNLLRSKDQSSIKHDRTQSSFTAHSQLIVSRRLLWRKLEKS